MNLGELIREQIRKNEKVEFHKVSIKQAYEWAKTGYWDLKTFTKWVEHGKSVANSEGFWGEE